MKEMVYKVNWITEILDQGNYRNYDYVIVSHGIHPCAYIRIPQGHRFYDKDMNDVNLSVHGGITFTGPLAISGINENDFYVGWDYAHCGDYAGYNKLYDISPTEKDKIWTTSELLDDVKNAIDQLNILDKNLTPEEALEKIDHTICLNFNEHTIKFGIDTFKEGPRNDSCDCESIDEFCECFEILREAIRKK